MLLIIDNKTFYKIKDRNTHNYYQIPKIKKMPTKIINIIIVLYMIGLIEIKGKIS